MNSSWNGFPNQSWEVNLAGTEAPAERKKIQMKKNLRGKIREFVKSEEGKVGIKSPLTLGIATGGLLVAQAIVSPTPALAGCLGDTDCGAGFICGNMELECIDQGPGWPPHCWLEGECEKDH